MVLDNKNDNSIKYITNKFFLMSFQMSFREKAQLMETFDSANVSFFNDTVKVYNFSGRAVDYPSAEGSAHSSMHQSSLTQLYNNNLRGTQLVKNEEIALIKVFNHLVYGYPMSLTVTYTGQMDKLASFALQFVVTKHTQSLPGLFDEKDLEDNYSVENVLFSEADSFRLKIIKEFFKAYNKNLIIERGSFPKYDIGVNIGTAETLSIISNEDTEFQSLVRKGLYGFVNYLEGAKSDFMALDVKNYGLVADNILKDLKNGTIDSVFTNEVAFYSIKNFLSEVASLKQSFQAIKINLEAGAQIN